MFNPANKKCKLLNTQRAYWTSTMCDKNGLLLYFGIYTDNGLMPVMVYYTTKRPIMIINTI